MIKITKKLIKEILRLESLTLQDIDILKDFIARGLNNLDNSKLFYQALKKYNSINND